MKVGIKMAFKLDEDYIDFLKTTEKGRKYLEYYEKFKSKPFAFGTGMPDIEELYGGVIGLYDQCIKQNKRWEQLLGAGWDELRR